MGLAMQNAICFEPLRLSDTRRLLLSNLTLFNQTDDSTLRDSIRQFLVLCDHQAWLVSKSSAITKPDDTQSSLLAVIGFQVTDPEARRATLHLFTDLFTDAVDDTKSLLIAILEKAFYQTNIYRLEFAVPENKTEWITAICAAGFQEEGKLRNYITNHTRNRHHNVRMHSFLRPEFKAYSTAFIPFSKGLFAISGDQNLLSNTAFIRYGDTFTFPLQQEIAEILGLLDESGRLFEFSEIKAHVSGQRFWILPDAPKPVLAAAEQVADYFSGRLIRFDLPLNLNQGSQFQQKVWQALSDIPYGSTWTYEELAYHLAPGDWLAARNLARAVGSACGANPLPLILPCHRVIGKNGHLVGFNGGLDIKEYLLDHEIMGLNE